MSKLLSCCYNCQSKDTPYYNDIYGGVQRGVPRPLRGTSRCVPIACSAVLKSEDVLKVKQTYQKKGSAGIEGSLFQINLLTIFLLNGCKKDYLWLLSTENNEAEKFDDIVFENLRYNTAILVQAKHRQNNKKKIKYEELFSVNSKHDDFSLLKYFFSYEEIKRKFKVQNVVICTNAGIDNGLNKFVNSETVNYDHVLYLEGFDNTFYTFNDSIVSDLEENVKIYYDENLQGKNIDQDIISTENIRHFLKHLQFFANFPNIKNLEQLIPRLISQLQFSEHLDSIECFKYIHMKMVDWFKEVKGRYLTRIDAQAWFSEIRSNKYFDTLNRYKICFKNYSHNATDRLLHIISGHEYLLILIKIYRTLQQINEKVLFVNPDDHLILQKHTVEAFELPYYVVLVVICIQTTNRYILLKMCWKIIQILSTCSYKRVILIGEENALFVKLLGVLDGSSDFYVAQKEVISFDDLAVDTQNTFLEQRNINFQGQNITLKELLIPLPQNLTQILCLEVLVKLMKNETIEAGMELEKLGENKYLYISRTFSQDGQQFSEEYMCRFVQDEGKIIVIADISGMGKTTVLTNLAISIKKNNPHLWVFNIPLINYTDVLNKFLYKQVNISIEELINSLEATKLKNNFEKNLFSLSGKIVLMFDGVDEISPDYTEVFLSLLTNCLEISNVYKIFVTTKPNIQRLLEDKFKVKSFALEPLTEGNQIEFLGNYWIKSLGLGEEKKEKCRRYAEILTKQVSSCLDTQRRWENDKTFAGIPLHTRILAEIFQESNLQEWEGCKEFLHSVNEEPNLPRKLNLRNLYGRFIEKKRDIFVNIKGNVRGNIEARRALEEKFKLCDDYHCKLAFEIVFDKRKCDFFPNRELNDLEDSLLTIGIVHKLNEKFHFLHRTFAEYYVAEYLVSEKIESPRLQKFLLNEILRNGEYNFTCEFIDSFLEKETLPENIFQEPDCKITLFRCFVSNFHFNFRNKNGQTALHHAVKMGHVNLTEFLLQRDANVNIRDNLGQTPLHLAAEIGNLKLAELLLRNGADAHAKNKKGQTADDIVQNSVNLKLPQIQYKSHDLKNKLSLLKCSGPVLDLLVPTLGAGFPWQPSELAFPVL